MSFTGLVFILQLGGQSFNCFSRMKTASRRFAPLSLSRSIDLRILQAPTMVKRYICTLTDWLSHPSIEPEDLPAALSQQCSRADQRQTLVEHLSVVFGKCGSGRSPARRKKSVYGSTGFCLPSQHRPAWLDCGGWTLILPRRRSIFSTKAGQRKRYDLPISQISTAYGVLPASVYESS